MDGHLSLEQNGVSLPEGSEKIPVPGHHEAPADYAARLGAYFVSGVEVARRRELAQFLTPVKIARFMAELAAPGPETRRLLDPGSGTAILACALCEALPREATQIHLDAFEIDESLAKLSERALDYARQWLATRRTKLTFSVHHRDFVTANAAALTPNLFDGPAGRDYDIAIANPPYFKLGKQHEHAVAASTIVHGQPNIYAVFMSIVASQLSPRGVMVTITPRSFATGVYFKRFRRHFFSTVVPDAVHVFQSRKDTFREDAVLQENVIVRARKTEPAPAAKVLLSTSRGVSDLDQRKTRVVPLAATVHLESRNLTFSIPEDETDDAVVEFMNNWPNTLGRLGLEVSTGPVVAFRAKGLLANEPCEREKVVPLLWLQNVLPMVIQWPVVGSAKPQYILDNRRSRHLLVRNATYVVLRRFTAKEERRRLVAAPLVGDRLAGERLGLENHLNYIHRPAGTLEADEAVGLAALLGSAVTDRFFRTFSGSTQVNAADLRALPLPAAEVIERLGSEVRHCGTRDNVEEAAMEILQVPLKLRKSLRVRLDG